MPDSIIELENVKVLVVRDASVIISGVKVRSVAPVTTAASVLQSKLNLENPTCSKY